MRTSRRICSQPYPRVTTQKSQIKKFLSAFSETRFPIRQVTGARSMPPCPFHAFIPPYPIRVDAFQTPRLKDSSMPIPDLHLLTHTHSDHLTGLSARSFAGMVICSKDAKEMLLNWESKEDRINFDKKFITTRRRGYEHLKIEPTWEGDRLNWERSRDLLVSPLKTCF